MPINTYECGKCGDRYELLVDHRKKHVVCNNCGARKLKKLIGAPTAHFKGSGFYETDYKSKSTPPKKSRPKKAKV